MSQDHIIRKKTAALWLAIIKFRKTFFLGADHRPVAKAEISRAFKVLHYKTQN